LRRYFSFASLTFLPIVVSIVSLPTLVFNLGINTWQEIVTGQGIGLILAEVVDGGWISFGPKLFGHGGGSLRDFRASLRERFPRFIVCICLGLVVIKLLQFQNTLIVSLSFLSWITVGINIHWVSIATGEASYSRNYVVFPRIAGQIVGIGLLFVQQSALTYLILQLIFSYIPLMLSTLIIAKKVLPSDSKIELPKNRAFIVIGNLFRSSTIWIIIVCGTILYQSDFAGFAAIFKYLDIVFSVSLAINLSNHSLKNSARGLKEMRKLQLHSIHFSVMTFLLSLCLWPLAEKLLFSNQIRIDLIAAFLILCVIPLRALMYNYIQDYLVVAGRLKTVLIIYSIQPIVIMIILIMVKNIELPIGLFPSLFLSCYFGILLTLTLMDSHFRKFLQYLITGNSASD